MKQRFLSFVICVSWAALCNAQYSGVAQKFAQAQQAIQSYQYEKALEWLSSCYDAEPDNVDYLFQTAYCHNQLGRYKDARMFYQQVLRQDSLHIGAIIALAGICEREGNFVQAGTWYGQLIELDSLNSYYHKKAAFAHLKRGDGMSAIWAFLEAYRLNEADLEVMDQLSTLYLELEADSSAMRIIQHGLNLDPNNVRLLQNHARLYNKRKDFPEVVASIQKCRMAGDSSPYYQMMLAVAYMQLDSAGAAMPLLEDLERKGKGTEHVYHYLGIAWREKGQLDTAAYWYNKAVDAAISPKTAMYYADWAAIRAEQKDFKAAAELYEKAFSYSGLPKDLFFWAQYCDLYYKDKNIALRHYQRYLNTGDTAYKEQVQSRIRQIREHQHFNK